MTTKVIFNMDKSLKVAAMKKARARGLNLSAVLNLATQSFVKGELEIGAFERDIAIGREQVKRGQTRSLDVIAKDLGIDI